MDGRNGYRAAEDLMLCFSRRQLKDYSKAKTNTVISTTQLN